MKQTNKKKIALGLLGLTAVSVMGAAAASALPGGFGHKGGFGGNEQIKEAVDANDFDAFVNAISEIDPDRAEDISEEDFAQIVEKHENREAVHDAIENEDYDAFLEAIEDAGKRNVDDMTEEKFQQIVTRHNAHEAARDAIEAGNYDAWVDAVSQLPHGADIADVVTEDEFPTLLEIHEAKQNGDRETARELAEEIGLPKRGRKGHKGTHGGFARTRGFRFSRGQ